MKQKLFNIYKLTPESIRTPLDIIRRNRVWRTNGVIFLHVPKAAGVSVSRALYGRPLGHFKAVDVRRILPTTFSDVLTFGVVRHPVDRLYSAYRFARSGGTSEMGIEHPSLYRKDAFSTFDRFVGEWLVKQELDRIDGVFRPQHLYLCDGDTVIVDHVIHLESIDDGMRIISSKLGRDVVLGHHNKSLEAPFIGESPATMNIIHELYKKDFEIFKYPLER